MDDTCIFAASIHEILDRMELDFEKLKAFNLKLKPAKSHFLQHSLILLGHILLAVRISANPEKVEKVQNWLVPTNAKELQSFLGLASYYQLFIPTFTTVTKCLHQLIGLMKDKKS